MANQDFFNVQTEQSRLKAEIVVGYFVAWARIMRSVRDRFASNDRRIGYVDLFCGPGRYEDGALSTPVRVLEKVIEDSDLSQRTVTYFNDGDKKHVGELNAVLGELPGIGSLKYPPETQHQQVDDDLVALISDASTIPLLVFIDPWGYQGLSRNLLNGVLKSWGCDCIFYFNYNRINPALSNDLVRHHMDLLFGRDRVNRLRDAFDAGLTPAQREELILRNLVEALQGDGHEYVQSFTFKAAKSRTSHYLIFVCDHFKGFEVMRDVMAKRSTGENDGVPDYTFDPFSSTRAPSQLSLLEPRPLEVLRSELRASFAGQRLSMRQIFEQHSGNRPYLGRNYKNVLLVMEEEGEVSIDRGPRGRKSSVADKAQVTFP